jgi:hypothetical protein
MTRLLKRVMLLPRTSKAALSRCRSDRVNQPNRVMNGNREDYSLILLFLVPSLAAAMTRSRSESSFTAALFEVTSILRAGL